MNARLGVVSVVGAVTADLRDRVLRGDLAPGTALGEVDVATEYGVARPTAKAAIEALVHERLLQRSAHRTARVVTLTPEDARDIYLSRQLIEVEAVRRLARRREVPDAARDANARIAALGHGASLEVVEPDIAFHRSLVDAVGSRRTSGLYASLASEVRLCMAQVQDASLLPIDLIASEHAQLLEHIENGDEDAAAHLLAEHIGRASERLAARLEARAADAVRA